MCDCFACVRRSPAAAAECGVLYNLVDIDQVWICGKWQMAYGIGFMLLALIYDFYDLAIVVIFLNRNHFALSSKICIVYSTFFV